DVFAVAPPPVRASALPTWRRVIADGVAFLRDQPGVRRDRIGVVGWSSGGYLALLSAADAPERYRAVVALSAPLQLPGGDDLRDRVGGLPATLILHGDADTVVPPGAARTLDSLLAGAGRRHELAIVSGGTHPWLDEAGRAGQARLLAFLTRELT